MSYRVLPAGVRFLLASAIVLAFSCAAVPASAQERRDPLHAAGTPPGAPDYNWRGFSTSATGFLPSAYGFIVLGPDR